MQQPPIINIQMVPAGVEYVLGLLNKQPREVSNELFNEIANQYGQQMAKLQAAAQAQAAQPAPANDAPAAAVVDEATGLTD